MNRFNIRTINGTRHNGKLPRRYQLVQNRASAVLDASDEFGQASTIEVVAHLHWLSVEQILKDLHGDPVEIKRRFGAKSTLKLNQTLKRCVKEIDEGIPEPLVAVANHIPLTLLRSFRSSRNKIEVIERFLREINEKLNTMASKKTDDPIGVTSKVRPTRPFLLVLFLNVL